MPRKRKIKIRRILGMGLLVFLGVLAWNTLTLSSRQLVVTPVEPVAVDGKALDRLAQAIRFPTVSLPDRVDTAAFQGLDSLLHGAFPLVDSLLELERVNRFSRLFIWRGKNPHLPPALFMAHADVVPVEENSRAAWTHPPFGGLRRDGYLYGRGTLDDKGSLMALLEAIEMLLEVEFTPARTLYFAFGHDEEVGGYNGAAAIARRLGERGLRFEFVLDEGGLIMQEALPGLSQPAALIGIGEKGYLTLDLSVEFEAGGHSSMPPRETALSLLSRVLVELQSQPFPARLPPPIRRMFEYAAPEMRFPYNLLMANLWCTEGLLLRQLDQTPATAAMIRTTAAPTRMQAGFKDNVLPTRATASVNLRLLPGETTASAVERVRRIADDPRLRISLSDSLHSADPPPLAEIESFGYQTLERSIREVFPETVVLPWLLVATTDSRHFAPLTDNILRFQPLLLTREDTPRFHGIDERIAEDNYLQMIRFYRQLLLNSSR